MSKRRGCGESDGEMVPMGTVSASMTDLMGLRPSDVIQFSVYDHEETMLFGVMRDQMMERGPKEPAPVWMARCGGVLEWNRWRSKLMTAVFVNAVVKRFSLDSDHAAMFRLAYVMAVGAGFLKEAATRYGKNSVVLGCLSGAYGGSVPLTGEFGGIGNAVQRLGEGVTEVGEAERESLGL
ncbi:MAG: hypothetical protein WC291_11725 [Thermodesulfovibrionales bacterium]|jgi:hypothetical protein